MQVVPGARISLHFSLSLADGDIIDSNFGNEPANFQLGDGSMLPGFEEQLIGLAAGDATEVTLTPDKAFGEVNPQNIHQISRIKFKSFLEDEYDSLEPGSVVSFKDPSGFDLSGVVKKKTDSLVIVDFNHPLAGKAIVFKAEIIAVTSA